MPQKYHNVALDQETFDNLSQLCKNLGMSKAEFLRQVITPLWEVGCSCKACHGASRVLMTLDESSPTKLQVTFGFLGRSNVIVGRFDMDMNASDKEVNAKVAEKCEETFNAEKKRIES